ncbi:hypothetical protein ABPG74_005101 [Tetrahymena malaccensis]
MNSSHSQQRKELPKVCKQFPEEFLFQRQKTAQPALNSLNRVDIEQFFDQDQIIKSNISTASSSATSNRFQNSLPFHKNVQFPQLSKEILNQIISAERGISSQNSKGSSINNIFQQIKQNNVQQEDFLDRQQLKQSFLHSLNQSAQQKMQQSQDFTQNMLQNSSKSKIFDGERCDYMVPIQRHRGSTNLNGQKIYQFNAEDEIMEDFKEKEDIQDSLDKIQISPDLHLLNFEQQNQASVVQIEKKERNNSQQSMVNKSQSSSTSKRIELKNKRNTNIVSSSFFLADSKRTVESTQNCQHSRNASKKNKNVISQTEQAIDSQQTEDEDSIQLKLGLKKQNKLETLEKSRVLIEKAMNQNSSQTFTSGNQIRASSSSACFLSNQQSNRSMFKQIPYILAPSSLSQKKEYLIQAQNQKSFQINQQLFLSRNNSIENIPNQISQSIHLSQNYSDKQIIDANLLNSPILRLPRLTLNADRMLLSINNSGLNFMNNNSIQDQQQADQNTCKDINSIGIKREIKTPNFNTRQANKNQNGSSLQVEEQKKIINQTKEKNETSFQNNQQIQALRTSNISGIQKQTLSNENDELNSFELEVKNSYYQTKQPNDNTQGKMNNKQQDLDASFGTNKNNKNFTSLLNEDQTLILLESSLNQQNNLQITQRKKNIAQKNFKCNKSLQVSTSKNQNHKQSTDILDDSLSQKYINFQNQTKKNTISNRYQERSLSNTLHTQHTEQLINAPNQIQNQKLSLHSYKNKESLYQRSQNFDQAKCKNQIKDQQIISFDIDSYYQNLQQNLPDNFTVNQQLEKQYPKKHPYLTQDSSNQKEQQIQDDKVFNDSYLRQENVNQNLLHTFNASKNTDQNQLQEIIQNFQLTNNHYLNCVDRIQFRNNNQLENKNTQGDEPNQKDTKLSSNSSQNQKSRIEINQNYFIQVKNNKYLQKKNLIQSKHKSADLKQIIQKQKTNFTDKTNKFEDKKCFATRSIQNQQDNINLYINQKGSEIQDPK